MIEYDVRYRPGTRTFLYLFLRRTFWNLVLAAAFVYLAYAVYFGRLHAATIQYLAGHPDWYIGVGSIAEWSLLTAVALFLIAYVRTSVHYREYTFYLDEHALHLRRGLIRVQEITIPYHQISNIHIEQPYHWRLLGLAKLDITITSSRVSLRKRKQREFLVPCIDLLAARELSHFLSRQASGIEEDEQDGEFEEDEFEEDISIESEESSFA